ncbi:MAG: transglycosylase family protein [Acidobacteriota bacterium]|nr:transglycosylase family protein [Acidobacteriota bacterium]
MNLSRPVWRRLPFVAPVFAGAWLGNVAQAPPQAAPRHLAVRPTGARSLANLPALDRAATLVPTTQPTTTATSAPAGTTTTTTGPGWADPVTPTERAAWYRVNACEEAGNWHIQGTVYSGGLGISEANWYAYGGQSAFGNEWAATPDEQIVVAMRIDAYPPDQHGCTGGW